MPALSSRKSTTADLRRGRPEVGRKCVNVTHTPHCLGLSFTAVIGGAAISV